MPDDCNTISHAIDKAVAGDTVFVKDGIYSERLVLKNGISLVGQSKEAVRLTADPNNNMELVLIKDCNDIVIGSISFDGKNQTKNGNLKFSNSSAIVKNCVITNAGCCGIETLDGSNLEVENCRLSQNKYAGVSIIQVGGQVKLLNNESTYNMNGLQIKGKTDVVINDNIFSNNKSDGVIGWDGCRGILENNVCSNNSAYGIRMSGKGTEINLVGNTCSFNKNSGILVYNSAKIDVLGNTCISNLEMGIWFCEGANGDLKKNICQKNRKHGIWIRDFATKVELTENQCNENIITGIYLYDVNQVNIVDNICTDNFKLGIFVEKSLGDMVVKNNTCSGNVGKGIDLEKVNSFVCSNNKCQSNGKDGIYIFECSYGTVEKNNCTDNWDTGIGVFGNKQILVKNNSLISNGTDGIAVGRSSEKDIIQENVCRKNYFRGIDIYNGGKVSVRSNIIENNRTEGIYVYGKNSYAEILNNTIKGNNHSGIFFDNGGSGVARENICENHPWSGISVNGKLDVVIENNQCNNNGVWEFVRWDKDGETGQRSR